MALIDQIKKKHAFTELPQTILKGRSNTIILNNYEYFLDTDYETRIKISEMHDGLKRIEDCFRLTVYEMEENEGVDLFNFTEVDKLFTFVELLRG